MTVLNNNMFKPTYLYIKTHNITKLKYFGKTTSSDPTKYQGSGIHWKRHIKKYGYDVTTEILGYYLIEDECLAAAKKFSSDNNIVESTEWANLKSEELDGGDTSGTENYQKYLPIMREQKKQCKWWNNGSKQTFTPFPPDESYNRGRLPFNNVGAKIGSEIQKNKLWANNGTIEMMVDKNSALMAGFVYGRLHNRAFAGGTGRHLAKGTHWWNNGKTQKMTAECPGPDWIRGRLINPSCL